MAVLRGPGISVPDKLEQYGPYGPTSPGWVYYDRLIKDKAYSTYKTGLSIVSQYTNSSNFQKELEKTADSLETMAKNERQKEINLLNQYFGGNFSSFINLYDADGAKELVTAFNEAFQLRGILERAIIRNEKNQNDVSIAAYFGKYYIQAIVDAAKSDKFNDLVQYITIDPKEANTGKFAEIELARYIEDHKISLQEDTLDRIKESKILGSDLYSQNSYEELTDYLRKNQKAKQLFFSLFYDIYGDSEVFANYLFSSNLQKRGYVEEKQWRLNIRPSAAMGYITFSKGGQLEEVLGGVAIDASLDALGIKHSTYATGGSGVKADITLAIGTSQMQKEVKNAYKNSNVYKNRQFGDPNRPENVKIAQDLANKLKKFTEKEFVVYTSVKNIQRRSLEGGFYKGDGLAGFSSGSAIKLQNYADMLAQSKNRNHVEDGRFITTIMNTISGALAERRSHTQEMETLIAKDIAVFLFDDLDTIGEDYQSGAQTIHLFLLDDFYFPLSELLYCVAKAVRGVIKDPSSVFQARINNDFGILYENGGAKYQSEKREVEGKENAMPYWTMEDWREQRKDALDKIKIEVSFLRDFLDMIQSYLE